MFVILLPFSQKIFVVVSKPLVDVLPGQKMIATAVASPLLTPFKLTFFVALFVAMPVVLYQVWAFVAPGLYKKEKRWTGSGLAFVFTGRRDHDIVPPLFCQQSTVSVKLHRDMQVTPVQARQKTRGWKNEFRIPGARTTRST